MIFTTYDAFNMSNLRVTYLAVAKLGFRTRGISAPKNFSTHLKNMKLFCGREKKIRVKFIISSSANYLNYFQKLINNVIFGNGMLQINEIFVVYNSKFNLK